MSELKAFAVNSGPDGWSELIFAQNQSKAKAKFANEWRWDMDQEFFECVQGLSAKRLPKADKYVDQNLSSAYILDWAFDGGDVHRENGFDVDGEYI